MSVINFTEFSTLTQCERKWAYAYVLGQEEQGAKKGLHLGTLCHLWHGRWLTGLGATLPSEWTDDINTGGKPGEVKTLRLTDFDPELVTRATWLAGRFVECYGQAPPSSWNVIGAEQWISRDFPWGTLVGRTDGFVEIDGNLWLIEVKSYGQRPGPLAYCQVSPQLGCYSLLAEKHFGQRPHGILYQGIYTYEWARQPMTQAEIIGIAQATGMRNADGSDQIENLSKKDQQAWAKSQQTLSLSTGQWLKPERPAEESFEQVEVELGDDHLLTASDYLHMAVARRNYLADVDGLMFVTPEDRPTALLRLSLPNVGRDCSWCGFKAQCWNDLGGVEEFEIEVEDDEALPV